MSELLDRNVKEFCLKIGFKLRALRVKQNLSQAEVAKKSILSRTSVTLIEGGKHNPTLYSASKIANVLGIKLDELVK